MPSVEIIPGVYQSLYNGKIIYRFPRQEIKAWQDELLNKLLHLLPLPESRLVKGRLLLALKRTCGDPSKSHGKWKKYFAEHLAQAIEYRTATNYMRLAREDAKRKILPFCPQSSIYRYAERLEKKRKKIEKEQEQPPYYMPVWGVAPEDRPLARKLLNSKNWEQFNEERLNLLRNQIHREVTTNAEAAPTVQA